MMPVLNKIVGFLNTTDPAATKAFYRDILGFELLSDDEYAVVFDANGTLLRIAKAREFTPAQGTVLGWEVGDIDAAIDDLLRRGVRFEQFNLAFMKQDDRGVWTPPNGDRVAWFKDPAGNMLSISQHAGRATT
jgi:catechol 2,3-dioxygenase-like lactoylglutathione lyase family enzyme